MNPLPYCYAYPHPAVTTDCVIFGFDGSQLNVLLIRRGVEPFKGRWAFPGGFLQPDETAETGALRELREETGLESAYLEQLHTFTDPDRDPRERVITVAYLALVKISEVQGGDDAAEAQWFALDEIPQLAFDHERIFRMAVARLRERIHFRPIGFVGILQRRCNTSNCSPNSTRRCAPPPNATRNSIDSTSTNTRNSNKKVSDSNSELGCGATLSQP